MTWRFNLKGDQVPLTIGGVTLNTFSASYFSMAGPDMEQIQKGGLMVSGDFQVYMNPQDARGSIAIQKLNPTKLFPSVDTTKHAFNDAIATHRQGQGLRPS